MKEVIILQGLPASGKTSYAKEILEAMPGAYKRVNKDDLRDMLDGGKYSRDNEKFVLKIRDEIILKALAEGKHVIVDDTNLSPKHENRIKELVKGKARVVTKQMKTSLEECIERDRTREKSVGEKVIRDMYNQFLRPAPEKIEQDETLPPAYIFDIDGTLALMKDRSPYEWDKVGEDELNEAVSTICLELGRRNSILIFTGRDGVCAKETRDWLVTHGIKYDEFKIRREGNTEKDSVVKRRMLEEVKDKYYIKGVFDDRNQVVEMWRELGLQCFQVANGDF